MKKTLIACLVTALAVGGGTATAAKFINGQSIKQGSIPLNRLSKGTQNLILRAGQPGKDGTSGTNGTNGSGGAKGDAGAKGENGAAGANGVNGAKGDTGAKGDKGDKGDAGAAGADGAAGATGADGVDGAKGDKGDKGDQGDQGPQGSSGAMPADFDVEGNLVKLTSDGVQYGPYADGSADHGTVRYDGLNGMTLADIVDLSFTAKFSSGDHSSVAVPYLRVFLNGGATDVIFSPNSQTPPDVAEDVFHTWDVTSGVLRYNDDDGDGKDDTTTVDTDYGVNGAPWATVLADHGTETISGIKVTTGSTGGTNVKLLLTDLGINNTSFHFGQG